MATKRNTCSEECRKAKNRAKNKAWAANNPDKVREMSITTRAKRRKNGKQSAYQQARRRSKEGYVDRFLERARSCNKECDLNREYLLALMEHDKCQVSGVAFDYTRKGGSTSWENPYSPSIDRIDSNLPYQQGNIQIVLTTINLAKNKMNMKDFMKVWKEITQQWKELTNG